MIALTTFFAKDFTATLGVNEGAPLSFGAELQLDDVYTLALNAQVGSLSVTGGHHGLMPSPLSTVGRPGNQIVIDSQLTFASATHGVAEILVLLILDGQSVVDVVLHPLTQLRPGVPYRLIQIAPGPETLPGTPQLSAALAGTTLIQQAEGTIPAADLSVGDTVLTQSHGSQPVLAVERHLLRADGNDAPILVEPGTLGNANPLVLGRGRRVRGLQSLGAQLNPLSQLTDLPGIRPLRGGYVEMIALTLPGAPVIFAEGVATDAGPVIPQDFGSPANRAPSSDARRLTGS